jgi:predicted phosphodiesterase
MKILCGPDLHIRVTAPEHRIDNFVETQKHKIKWMLRLIDKHKCQLALFPGDITDHSRLPYYIVDYYIRLFKLQFECAKLAVLGQHDMLYHVESKNTPISVMDASEAIELIGSTYHASPEISKMGYAVVYGVDFDEEIPKIKTYSDPVTNILLIHKMFVDDKLWEGQEEYKRANIFLRENKWDLIVSGDNHQHFMLQSGGRFHVNCGTLMRQKIDEIHHKPVVYIYDTEAKTLSPHYIPIDPPEQVFNIEAAEAKKEKDKDMEAFVEMVRDTTEIEGLDFAKNLDERLVKEDISDELRDLHKEVMAHAGERLGDK